MADSLVFTIIGDDRPGIVEQVARAVNEHEANWLGSRMSRLGGKFAGMIHVAGAPDLLAGLKAALEGLPGLTVVVEAGRESPPPEDRLVVVTMLGLDRPGIVREVSAALAAENLNVLELTTEVSPAAMTGEPMFSGEALVACGGARDLAELSERLDQVSGALGVDVAIDVQEDA